MGNFRPDKKLKRKRARKKWRKNRNILENWWKEERNRRKAGLPRRAPPVRFAKKRKYPTRSVEDIMKEAKERATKYKEDLKTKKAKVDV